MADQDPEKKTWLQSLGCLRWHERFIGVIKGYAMIIFGAIILGVVLYVGSFAFSAYRAVGNVADAVVSAPGNAWSATKRLGCEYANPWCDTEREAAARAEKEQREALEAAEAARIQAEEEAAETAAAQAEAEETRQQAEAEANGETEPGLFSRGWDRATDWIPGVGGDDAPAEENTE